MQEFASVRMGGNNATSSHRLSLYRRRICDEVCYYAVLTDERRTELSNWQIRMSGQRANVTEGHNGLRLKNNSTEVDLDCGFRFRW